MQPVVYRTLARASAPILSVALGLGLGTFLGLLPSPAAAQGLRVRGSAEVEWRGFPADPVQAAQADQDASLVLTGLFSRESAGRRHLLTFEPFVRIDSVDGHRTHLDVRALAYEHAWERAELRVGVRRVFWGVTESRHLVDVVNQTDLVENPDGEDKLGQPMVNLAWITRAGTVDLFLLAGFRERRFPGQDGRLRPELPVDHDLAVFEDDGAKRHLGWAARWTYSVGGLDLGVSHFNGTARDPRLVPRVGMPSDASTVTLVPHYVRVHQTAVDAQWTSGSWLWKFEGMTRTGGPDGRQAAMVGGVEYTVYQLFGTAADLGLLGEVLVDSRDAEPFQDDLFAGARLAFNDTRGTELLAGVIVDRESRATLLNIEASRRLSGSLSLAIEVRGFMKTPATDPIHAYRQDDHVLLRLTRWF